MLAGDGKMANRLEEVWSKVATDVQLTMPVLGELPNMKAGSEFTGAFCRRTFREFERKYR